MVAEVNLQRIQKLLSAQGIASRRQVDEWLQQGRIRVNGRVAKPGDQISGKEKLSLDDKPLRLNRNPFKPKLLMYHKPVGQISTRNDPEHRPTVFSSLPGLANGRWIGIGRLDINTSGLMLFTNDGELANRMMHPSSEIKRIYAVRIHGQPSAEQLKKLTSGVELEDGMASFDELVDAGGQGQNHWYHVSLHEGRNREVRRLWEAIDMQVSRLMRIAYGPFTLPKWLKPGNSRYFEERDVKLLYQQLSLDFPESQTISIKKSAVKKSRNPRKVFSKNNKSR